MPRDPDTATQEDLFEKIHRFPHQFPMSIGGLGPEWKKDTVTDADRRLDEQLPDETGHPQFERNSKNATDNGWCENDN